MAKAWLGVALLTAMKLFYEIRLIYSKDDLLKSFIYLNGSSPEGARRDPRAEYGRCRRMERARFLSPHRMFPSHHSAGAREVSKGRTGNDLPVSQVTMEMWRSVCKWDCRGTTGTAVRKGLLNLTFPDFFESSPARPSTTAAAGPA